MNVGCHVNATPHVVGQVFVTDNAEGGTLVDACDGKIIKPCLNCPEQPRAYHNYNVFKVYENTNRPFEQVVSNFALNLLNCNNFADFIVNPTEFDAKYVVLDLCAFASSRGIPPFQAKIRQSPNASGSTGLFAFNVYTDCNSIPNLPLEIDQTYILYINGLNCNITFSGPTQNQSDLATCLDGFDYSVITSAFTYQFVASELCNVINSTCALFNVEPFQIDLMDSSGIIAPTFMTLGSGCVTTSNTTSFVVGQTYYILIDGAVYKEFTITS